VVKIVVPKRRMIAQMVIIMMVMIGKVPVWRKNESKDYKKRVIITTEMRR